MVWINANGRQQDAKDDVRKKHKCKTHGKARMRWQDT
jgi:hypothetical protein